MPSFFCLLSTKLSEIGKGEHQRAKQLCTQCFSRAQVNPSLQIFEGSMELEGQVDVTDSQARQ